MVAHFTTLNLCPNKMDEGIRFYEHRILPLVQQQTGCRFITLLAEPVGDQLIAISWWESEADLLAGQSDNHYQQQLAQIGPLLLTLPLYSSYQVKLQVAPI